MTQEEEADLQSGDARSEVAAALANAPAHDDAASVARTEKRQAKGGAALSEFTRTRLATQLRAMYDTVAQQPVPDRFADLIAQLESADVKKT